MAAYHQGNALREYLADAYANKPTEHYYANGITYLFITEDDGWISILDVTDSYLPVALIQAADIDHAKDYCIKREPLTVPVNFL